MPKSQVVNNQVTVAGIVPGTPPVLAWSKRLRGRGGREKVHTQWVKVLDPALYQRLQEQVRVGDEILATVVTDWEAGSYTTYLADFSLPAECQPADLLTAPGQPSQIGETTER